MFGCKHVFGEVKDGYQYCKKCGKAIVAPYKTCSHKWIIEHKLQKGNAFNDFTGLLYMLRCVKCGDIKKICT